MRAFADTIQRVHKDCKTNMPSIERSFFYSNTFTIWAIFLYYWTQCIDGFSFFYFYLFFVTERTQLNAVYVQLLEKLRPIAFAETCRLVTIQSLEFQEFGKKKSSEPCDGLLQKIWILDVGNF